MRDSDCVQFLQGVLPRLRMRWPGFRKVRRQVCRRVDRRMHTLGLSDVAAYRNYLGENPAEWERLDEMCRISISRFYRDRGVFDLLRKEVMPLLARQVGDRGDTVLHSWSAGCASGEEAYTLKLIWELELQHELKHLSLHITATDADAQLLQRARRGCYPKSSVKDFPAEWADVAFQQVGDEFCVRAEFRSGIDLICQDIRREYPEGPFDLILCRHLVFTYFDESLQTQTAEKMIAKLRPGGFLVTGKQETLPQSTATVMQACRPRSGVYRRKPY